ncbi:hypothetical protein ATCC90586_006213 [Pythium insidiosum]|nr:hypothetical protein ATCC90586_006213 [Pythium insidiosum]
MSSKRRPTASTRGRAKTKSKPAATASVPDVFSLAAKPHSPQSLAIRQWHATRSLRRNVLDRPQWWRTATDVHEVALDAVRSLVRAGAESLVNQLRVIAPRTTGALRLRHVYPAIPPALMWILDSFTATAVPTDTPAMDENIWLTLRGENSPGKFVGYTSTAVAVVEAENVSGLRFALQRSKLWAVTNSSAWAQDTTFRPRNHNAAGEPEERGFVTIQPGRCFVFPSSLDYRIELPQTGSGLADPTQPGRVRLVFLHLVDPERHVRSSTVLPPPQPKWILDTFLGPLARALSLPWPVQALIGEFLNIGVSASDAPTPMDSLAEAKPTGQLATMKIRSRAAMANDPPRRRTLVETELLHAVDTVRLHPQEDEQAWMRSTLQKVLTTVCANAASRAVCFSDRLSPSGDGCSSRLAGNLVDVVAERLASLDASTEEEGAPPDRYLVLGIWCALALLCASKKAQGDIDAAIVSELCAVEQDAAAECMAKLLLLLVDGGDISEEHVQEILQTSDSQFASEVMKPCREIARDLDALKRWLRRQWNANAALLCANESAFSDSAVPSDLRTRYLSDVAPLRHSSDSSSVSFLIDPSLYPLLPLKEVPRWATSLVAHSWWGPLQRLQSLLVADNMQVLDAPPNWVPADVAIGPCGDIPIVQDRCVVIPNYLEMCVQPLVRQNESAPGKLHVLFFHLVNPTRVFVESSTTAPPLRADWVQEATTSALARAKRLPNRVQHLVEEMIGPMGMSADDVAKYRQRLRGVHLFEST